MNLKRIVLIFLLPLVPVLSVYDSITLVFFRAFVRQIKYDWSTWKEAWDSHSRASRYKEPNK